MFLKKPYANLSLCLNIGWRNRMSSEYLNKDLVGKYVDRGYLSWRRIPMEIKKEFMAQYVINLLIDDVPKLQEMLFEHFDADNSNFVRSLVNCFLTNKGCADLPHEFIDIALDHEVDTLGDMFHAEQLDREEASEDNDGDEDWDSDYSSRHRESMSDNASVYR